MHGCRFESDAGQYSHVAVERMMFDRTVSRSAGSIVRHSFRSKLPGRRLSAVFAACGQASCGYSFKHQCVSGFAYRFREDVLFQGKQFDSQHDVRAHFLSAYVVSW